MKPTSAQLEYRQLSELVATDPGAAQVGLRQLLAGDLPASLAALCYNDLGVLLAAQGDRVAARAEFALALAADPGCAPAQANLKRLDGQTEREAHSVAPATSRAAQAPESGVAPARLPRRVALVSLLFNWPSSGGGIHDTVGLGKALLAAGVELRHFYLALPQAGVGQIDGATPLPGVAISPAGRQPTADDIKRAVRNALEAFAPAAVIITDCWNFKPHLLEALSGFRCYLRFHGAELLCPLNNIRYRPRAGRPPNCRRHFLATPQACLSCLAENRACSGPLHSWERKLAGVEEPGFHSFVLQQLAGAAGAAVNNPLLCGLLSPYLPNCRTITSGVEAARYFVGEPGDPPVKTILMAGVVEEPMKGFAVLRQACALLRHKRQDFRLLVTGQRPGKLDAYSQSVGWQTPEALPQLYAQADICVVPSVCEEACGIVALEAMAAGRPVVASRIGGLQFTLLEEVTGLLFAPGDAAELAGCLARLLEDAPLRHRLGAAGRQRAARFDWAEIIHRDYLPLLSGAGLDG